MGKSKLDKKIGGKTYRKSGVRPLSSKREARKKAAFYKRHKVFKSIRVIKTKDGYQLYVR